ncbi:toxin-activating lysine-acyltransferase [Rhizobium sp. TRM95111]|uniref:toxin-activating lysine-acyltransferase n=1 Tax=Rhizobium alarense TaxID=2846851 RepID=UPI001F014121|nr:toxin-activating lysine-acyltransferase [Rhizobium alarense]MCF3639021.1 toxin-activating lysine-acyltransferase [Rhizobium alarense]
MFYHVAQNVPDGLTEVKTRIRSTFGQVVLAMSVLPRYRHHSIADLSHLVIDPLARDRIAIAQQKGEDGEPNAAAPAAIAIWATVSPEVDSKIREQIAGGSFPVRLKAEEWASGEIARLLDVIAPTQKLATAVLAGFRQVAKQENLHIHPIVGRLVGPEALKALGAKGQDLSERSTAPSAAVN